MISVMISGMVNEYREAVIPVVFVSQTGDEAGIEAVIDTGFSGDVTLPVEQAEALELTWLGREPGVLANGHIELFDVYWGTVIWDGMRRVVEVAAAEAQPLVGMNLLDGHSIRIEVVIGGAVEIASLP